MALEKKIDEKYLDGRIIVRRFTGGPYEVYQDGVFLAQFWVLYKARFFAKYLEEKGK